jgi:hypothetical protein
MSATPSRRTFEFGPDDCLVAAITDPPGGASKIGAVVAGMGIAEFRVARMLANLGIVTLQVREKNPPADWNTLINLLNAEGVRYCKESIEVLRDRRGVERFICMGNCGRGSIPFRVALEDPRVVGLILSNPHISPALTIRESYAQRLLSAESWRRLLSGKADLKYHLPNARLLAMSLFGRVAGIDEKKLIDQSGHNKDLTLPDRFDERVRGLTERGVRVLMAFAENDEGLAYFRRLYGQSFEKLKAIPGVSLELLATSAHVISQDDDAAGALAGLISAWVRDAGFASPATRAETSRPLS